ncbi:MAG: general stress protein, partial [Vicinamibacterales bacterium]
MTITIPQEREMPATPPASSPADAAPTDNPEGELVLGPAQKGTVIAVYSTHVEAEEAVRALQTSGFDITQLSIIGRGHQTEEQVVGYYTTGGRMKAWGPAGAFWGALWELLLGSAYFILPDI